MSSSAERAAFAVTRVAALLVALGVAACVLASEAAAPAFAPRIAAEIAARWSVDPAAVVLDWSRAAGVATMPADVATRLEGPARDGWFTLLVTPASGAARAWPVRAGVCGASLVAARDLATGGTLTAADLRPATITMWGAPSRDDATAAPGWEIRRPIAAGEPLKRPAVAPPPLVTAGGPVTLEWVQNGVRVTLGGVALHAARAHETVRVRLDNGRAVRTARVTGPGAAALMEDAR
jgi:flagella basal body P-ring formation protein FlgA